MNPSLRNIIPPYFFSCYHWIWAFAGTIRYGFPSRDMTVIGITGTDGKTSSTVFTAAIFEKAGFKVGLVNGLKFKIGEKEWKNVSDNSTPGKWILREFLSQCRKEGCKIVIIEVTSWAISQWRVWGIDFDVVAMTNLTHEHLDLHGSMEKYRDAKGKLFRMLKTSFRKKGVPKVSIVNRDDDHYEYFSSFEADIRYSYGLHPEADFIAKDIALSGQVLTYTLVQHHASKGQVKVSIPALFQVPNTLVAIACAASQNISFSMIFDGIASVTHIPGRMEIIDMEQPFSVIVDYAHTPWGFHELFRTARMMSPKGNIIAVYGATGGRDVSRRPLMGKVAGEMVDFSILTTEDPRFEDPEKIASDIEVGLQEAGGKKGEEYEVVIDRAAAIRQAFQRARPGDVVLLCSMGHQTSMYVKEKKVHWDDREEARKALKDLGYGKK
ncbi:MAG: UDP-N-acetylmuramoyl-L-alanyl-D-glutamate--2,6-diaminopimelate ligase [Parcubacteria group bacterium]|nr:UDP-N-acetylmuramoyl-L-alanyl-D-glutamate--2,6-diaminopimelate ligase [Parcubacteria group bacterium]